MTALLGMLVGVAASAAVVAVLLLELRRLERELADVIRRSEEMAARLEAEEPAWLSTAWLRDPSAPEIRA